ncbi:hypothetical protein BV20DRAFT_983039 [Pilatotrama ljubarskyi]|nr:hypothetical protein BV20DRAFT_983039 [Pilatotrama ljubarskyi]
MSDIPPPVDDMESFFRRHRDQLSQTSALPLPTGGPPATPARQPTPRQYPSISPSPNLTALDAADYRDLSIVPEEGHHSPGPSAPTTGGDTSDDNNIDPLLHSSGSDIASSRELSRPNPDMIITTGHARPGNLFQYAEREAIAHGLQGDTKAAFIKWTKANAAEREAAVSAMLFSIEAQLKALTLGGGSPGGNHAGAVPWTVPERISRNINKYAIRLLLSPNLAEYDGEGLVETLSKIVEQKGWGLPENMRKQDEDKWECIVACIRAHLTQRKSEIKKALLQSVGMDDRTRLPLQAEPVASGSSSQAAPPPGHHVKPTWHIYQLCKYLTTAMGKKSGINTDLVITLEMCARVAFLRKRSRVVAWVKYPYIKDRKTGIVKNYSTRFYQFVDRGLEAFRTEGKGNRQKVHALFVGVLGEDQTFYPPQPNASHKDVFLALWSTNPSEAQDYVEQFIVTPVSTGDVPEVATGEE